MRVLPEDIVYSGPDSGYKIVQFLGRKSIPDRDSISIAVETVDKGTRKPEHFHRVSEEVFFVLSGYGILTVDGTEHELTPGMVILIEIGDKHFLRASEDHDVSVLLISTPAYQPSDYILC